MEISFIYVQMNDPALYLPRYRGILHCSWQGTTLSLPPGLQQSAVPLELSWTELNYGIKWERQGTTKRESENTRQSQRRNLNQTAVLYQSSVFVFMVLSWLAAVSIPHVISFCDTCICVYSVKPPSFFALALETTFYSFNQNWYWVIQGLELVCFAIGLTG